MRDYYKTLGLPLNATPFAVKAAYHELARAHHPDVADRVANSDQLMRDINQAYSVLGDPKLRRAYDTGRRHTFKDRDSRKHRVKIVGSVAAAITVCLGLALVYAIDRDVSFEEQVRSASSRSNTGSRATEKAEPENASERSIGLARQSEQPPEQQPGQQPEQQSGQQVAEWRLATKNLPKTASPHPTLPSNERAAGDPGSETRTSDLPTTQPPDSGNQSKRSSAKMDEVRGKDQTDQPTSQDVALWDSNGLETISKPPARRKERTPAKARETVPRSAALRTAKPEARPTNPARIGQSWSQSWTLIAKRWSPRFSVRHFRIDLEKDCASCKWVKFVALRHDVRIHEARIHYSDGTSRRLDVSGNIEDGHETKPQKLGVRFAKFSFISVTHQSRFNLHSGGWIAVYGIEDLGTDEEPQRLSRRH
ncbi:MAG: DnaJ domain-containing protein [Pseudomonadota bacterium]